MRVKVVLDRGLSSALSGHKYKRLWFLLLLVVAAANSSGSRILIAGIKVLLFPHTLLL